MILKLKPACKDHLWGGNKLREEYGIASDKNPLAEAWICSTHPDGLSIIEGGEYDGMSLRDYLKYVQPDALGTNCQGSTDLPVLVKFFDANDSLSIQVHPDDDYAMIHNNQCGKTECGYILEAEEGASVIYGFEKEITKEEFREHIENDTLTDVLHEETAKKGDLFFIPAGVVHGYGKGLVLFEVMQNSDVTYRVNDYGRRDKDGKKRTLHVEQALDVSKLEPVKKDWDFGGHLVRCDVFTLDIFNGDYTENVDESSYAILTFIDGDGYLENEQNKVKVRKGECYFLPAGSSEYRITGDVTTMRVLSN